MRDRGGAGQERVNQYKGQCRVQRTTRQSEGLAGLRGRKAPQTAWHDELYREEGRAEVKTMTDKLFFVVDTSFTFLSLCLPHKSAFSFKDEAMKKFGEPTPQST